LRAAASDVVEKYRCSTTWSDPCVQIVQKKLSATAVKTVMRTVGSRLNQAGRVWATVFAEAICHQSSGPVPVVRAT